jgi:two-component system, LytTR family, response regulator
VDYLLKPFDAARLRQALDRARQRIARVGGTADDERFRRVARDARPAGRALSRLLVRTPGGTARLLPLHEVDWIEAEENYVRLHSGADSYLVRGTLTALEERLDPERFVRAHRSHIVNLEAIRELHPWSHGDWKILLHTGRELMLSRRFRDRLPELSS